MALTRPEDSILFESLSFPVVLAPILRIIEERDPEAAKQLSSAFRRAELQHSGFTYDLLKEILTRAGLFDKLDVSETFLRLEALNRTEAYFAGRKEDYLVITNARAQELKKILCKIPEEIDDRKKFLETIKEIAGAIKNLLDAVALVTPHVRSQADRQALERQKREFVRHSKHFSTTLKTFFKENSKAEVFLSANHLINETNMILNIIDEAHTA